MESETLVVRKVNKQVYKRFRQKALEADTNVGEAITEAMKYWLGVKKKNKINPKNLLKLNGLIKTSKRVNWSKQIDSVLYGGKA